MGGISLTAGHGRTRVRLVKVSDYAKSMRVGMSRELDLVGERRASEPIRRGLITPLQRGPGR